MQKVIDYLVYELKLKEQDTIVVGVSYGPDSMTLLSILKKIQKEIPFRIICAHVNHNVRRASKKEKMCLEEWCSKNDILFESMVIDTYGDDNFHNEARHIRYHFFTSLIEKYHANYLMTAHHGDDLIETVLMRLVRGSTLKGYSGFAQVVDYDTYRLVRPLLTVTKAEIESYVKKYKIPYAVDQSNKKSKYTRNRYRKYVLPFLKSEDPKVHEKFLKYSKLLEETDAFINQETKKCLSKVYHDRVLSVSKYLELDPFLQKKVLYQIMESIYQDDLMLVTDRHITLLSHLITSKKKNAFLNLPNQLKIVKSYDTITIGDCSSTVDQYEVELFDYALLPNGKHLEVVTESELNGNDICRLSKVEVAFPLYVRTRKHGDKIALKGTDGHKKVKDIFIDRKIPLKDRDLWPIVVDSKGIIVWIPGIKKSKFNKQKNEKCDIIIKYY